MSYSKEYSREYARRRRAEDRNYGKKAAKEWLARKLKDDPEYLKKLYKDNYKKNGFNHYAKATFGMSGEELKKTRAKLESVFGEKCWVCGRGGEVARIVIDHCHETQKIRGLLCHNCNLALGLLRDDQEIVHNLLSYISGA